jgi:hypothetical protein
MNLPEYGNVTQIQKNLKDLKADLEKKKGEIKGVLAMMKATRSMCNHEYVGDGDCRMESYNCKYCGDCRGAHSQITIYG